MESKLKLKHGLATHSIAFQIMASVCEQVKSIPEYQSRKMDPEMTTAIAKLVQKQVQEAVDSRALTSKQAEQIDKGAVLCDIMCRLFDLDEEDIAQLKTHIEFLVNNKILKDKRIKRTMIGAAKWLLKKLI